MGSWMGNSANGDWRAEARFAATSPVKCLDRVVEFTVRVMPPFVTETAMAVTAARDIGLR
jgi:hypothetical protein